MKVKNYIFGYGSLISDESRSKTGKSGRAIPVRVKGVQRQWNLVAPDYHMTAVGAIDDPNSNCNGVIIQVSIVELAKFDEREIPYGYSRIKLESDNITNLTDGAVPSGDVWTYVVNDPGKPTSENPIVQSYIDVILTGCLGFGEDFAREFVATTQGWDKSWINDRDDPRYPRAMKKVPQKKKIDEILSETIPNEFYLRK